MGIPIEEPEKFEYTPGKGIVAVRDGIEIIAGNRLFLEGHRVVIRTAKTSHTDSEVFVARDGNFLGTLGVATRSGPKQRKRFKISNQWDSRRFFSPGTLVAWRKTSEESSVWTRSPLNCCPKISWNM